jgi:nicotinate-nucleotide pyrophosphorylase (carboxylating)
MLDNFSLADAARAVALRNESGSHALLEISGNLDRLDLAEVVQTGVDLMSMGALIHQATWMDLSLRFESIAP